MLLKEVTSVNNSSQQDSLEELERSIPSIIDYATKFFNTSEIKVEPAGFVTNPSEFEEHSTVDVSVYLNDGRNLNQEASRLFQRFINRKLIFSFGLLHTIVFD